ncbi:hypothetical protein [Trinickia sp.]|uniref:hypothetical protein n=1 Tax=Trinickia sp. TaxID=2571163 RepID=UPI003F80D680
MDTEKEQVASSLRGLHARTVKGVTSWHVGEDDRFYTDNKGVRIVMSMRTGGEFDADDYVVSFFSLPTLELIFEFTDVDLKEVLPKSYLLMRDLFQQARLSARGFKSLLDESLADLARDDPDGVPF